MKEKSDRIISIGIGKKPAGIGIYAGGKKIGDTGARGKLVDLVFVIDTTGSMSDKIDALLNTAETFVDDFSHLQLDSRIAVVAFGDLTVGDRIDTADLSADIHAVKAHLRGVPRFCGGANEGESSLEAIAAAMRLRFRQGAVRVLLLITDEPALECPGLTTRAILDGLRAGEFLTFTIAPRIQYYVDMARQTGGQWFEISAAADFARVLDLFRSVAANISGVASNVHQLAGGSVRKYLALNPPTKS